MKEADYAIIQAAAQQAISAYPYLAKEHIDHAQLTAIVTNIYLNADSMKAVTNHIDGLCTIIATPHKVALIMEAHSTYWQEENPIVKYEDLTADIINILESIDLCFIRISLD